MSRPADTHLRELAAAWDPPVRGTGVERTFYGRNGVRRHFLDRRYRSPCNPGQIQLTRTGVRHFGQRGDCTGNRRRNGGRGRCHGTQCGPSGYRSLWGAVTVQGRRAPSSQTENQARRTHPGERSPRYAVTTRRSSNYCTLEGLGGRWSRWWSTSTLSGLSGYFSTMPRASSSASR